MNSPRKLLIVALVAFFVSPAAIFSEDHLRDVIDQQVEAGWNTNKVTPAEASTDSEFLRRVYLDLLGVIPSYEEAVAFLDDAGADKRERLIDTLLADQRFGVHQSDVWDMVYFGRNPPGYGTNKRDGFKNWLRDQFNQNVSYRKWAGDILRAEGNTVEQGAPMFFVQYKNAPEIATQAITQQFLGVQLQCARCHDHPFDKWSQLDFYGMAAFLARLQVVDVGKKKLTTFAIGEKNLGDVLFTGPASQQEVGQKGELVKPKFLGGESLVETELPKDVKDPRNFPAGKMPPKPQFSRKDQLAEWITSPNNPYFARAAANRIWGQFMGKGIVDPVDNLSDDNPASHPELLDALAKSLVEHDFDLKWLIREIVNSRPYQLASRGPVHRASQESPALEARPVHRASQESPALEARPVHRASQESPALEARPVHRASQESPALEARPVHRASQESPALEARPVEDAKPGWFERARFRPLSAEELFESWMVATGYDDVLEASGKKPKSRFDVGAPWVYMIKYFGTPNDGVGDFQGGMHEHFYLNNGEIHQLISEGKGSLFETLSKSEEPWEKRVERMYVCILTRRPNPEETKHFAEHLKAEGDLRERLKEAIWTLMTCSEFRFNH